LQASTIFSFRDSTASTVFSSLSQMRLRLC
jgi:hypothetical protein